MVMNKSPAWAEKRNLEKVRGSHGGTERSFFLNVTIGQQNTGQIVDYLVVSFNQFLLKGEKN
jgi:hypothetical protein